MYSAVKSLSRYGYLFLIFMLFTAPAKASHLLGAELFYNYQSTNGNDETYKVTMKLFADCGSNFPNGAYVLLPSARPGIRIYNGNTLVSTILLDIEPYPASDIEITPVCPSQKDSTKCQNVNYVLPGVKRFTYSGSVTLSGKSADWRFVFVGELNNGSSAGRSTIINNIFTAGGNSTLTLVATLNNTGGPNSSTEFTSEPTPFFCINKPQQYNLGAIDPDGDNLTVSLVSALEATLGNCTYLNPYTPTAPIATVPGSLTFNPVNGQLSFTPNLVMNGVVVNRVDEYRNGVLVGSSMREMTFVIIDNCNNDAPEPGFVVDIDGGFSSAINEVSTCEGQTNILSFSFSASDPNGDTITISYNGLPPGASIVVDNNSTPNPTVNFSWDITNVTPGTYTYFVTFTDNGCPLASRQTIGYTIKIAPLMSFFDTGVVVGCRYEPNSMAWLYTTIPDTTTYTFTWWDSDANELQTRTGGDGDTLFNMYPGTYTVLVRNTRGCVATRTITIPDPGYHAAFTADSFYCIDTDIPFINNSSSDFTSWEWDFGDGNTSTDREPVHVYDTPGRYRVRLIAHTDFPCADTAYMNIRIDSLPKVDFVTSKDRICEGERVVFVPRFTGSADSIAWTIGDTRLSHTPPDASPVSFVYDASGMFTVSLSAYYTACPDSTFMDTIYVFPYPVVNLRADTFICPGAPPIELQNLSSASSIHSYTWSTGESSPSIQVYEPGVYSVTAVAEGDCATTDSVTVGRSCYLEIPNVFSPNGDGINDYFFPRQMLSMQLTSFHMRIYNRWGIKLYETDRLDGRGWDGKFNGEIQPGGVYVYVIKAVIDGHIEENRQGNVTLLR
jgi:gliding motility-associated-like protein